MTLYAVFTESLDMDLKVFEDNEAEANAELQARENAGKTATNYLWYDPQDGLYVTDDTDTLNNAVKIDSDSVDIVKGGQTNGAQSDDPEFWEAIFYYNGSYKLMQRFSWHKDPDPEGYYADFVLKM